MSPGLHARPLSPEERRIAEQVFGDALPLWRIAVGDALGMHRPAGLLVGTSYTIEPGPDRFVHGGHRAGKSGALVHELTHVWQAIYGGGRVVCALRHDEEAHDDRSGASWESYDVEQQAQIVERWYLSGAVETSEDQLFRYIRDEIRRPVGRRWDVGPFVPYHDHRGLTPEALLDAVQGGLLLRFEPSHSGAGARGDRPEAPKAPPPLAEKAHELAFVVTCRVTGKPLPNVPYEVYDEEKHLVSTGRTNRRGEARWDAGVPGRYKVVAFPNDRARLDVALFDDNGHAIANTDVRLTDSEGTTFDIRTSDDGVASCDNVQCGRVTLQVGDKRVHVYLDSLHRSARRVRVQGYLVPPPAWRELADQDHEPEEKRDQEA